MATSSKKVKKRAATAPGIPSFKKETPKFGRNMAELEDDDDVDFESLVQGEYMLLHRQYRLMENACQHLLRNAVPRKDQARMDCLTQEKLELSTDLYNADAPNWEQLDKKETKTIARMLEEYDELNGNIEAANKALLEMNHTVENITKRLLEQQLRVQSIYGRSLTCAEAERRLRILENRLYIEMTKLDTKVSENKGLRDEIQGNLQLRGHFHDRVQDIKKLINGIKQRMGEVVYMATSAYELRDEWSTKDKFLRERDEKESKTHTFELKELSRILRNDNRLARFMRTKVQTRNLDESVQERRERKKALQLKQITDRLERYEKSFQAIVKYAHQKNMNTVIRTYLNAEHTNFNVFRCIADLNAEISAIHSENLEIAKQINSLNKSKKDASHFYNEKIRKFDEVIKEEEEKLSASIISREIHEKKINLCLTLVQEICGVLGCDISPIEQLLGCITPSITLKNLKLGLRLIERRIEFLMERRQELQVRKTYEAAGNILPMLQGTLVQPQGHPSGHKHISTGGPFLPKVAITGFSAEAEEEDEADRSFSERPRFYQEIINGVQNQKLAAKSPPEGNKNGHENK